MIVQWDMQLGPNPLVQYPPEASFPPKEILLKIWARHEMGLEDRDFISLQEGDLIYCSLLKQRENRTYFIILELATQKDIQIFQEIIGNVADELIKNLNTPNFPRIISDTYKLIKNYTVLDENQLMLRLFEEEIRLNTLTIVRKGPLSKIQLRNRLENAFHYSNFNIDLIIAPFLRLGLIKIKKISGTEETLFLVNDLFCCKIPPKVPPENEGLKQRIQEYFATPQIIEGRAISKIATLFQKPGVLALFNKLEQKNNQGISATDVQQILHDDSIVFENLLAEAFIVKDDDSKIHLVATPKFFKINPRYLIPIITKRYEEGDISIEHLIEQIKIIENSN